MKLRSKQLKILDDDLSLNKAFRSDSVLDDNVADIKIFEYVGLFSG